MKLFFFTYDENVDNEWKTTIDYVWADNWQDFGRKLDIYIRELSDFVVDNCGLVWTMGEIMTESNFHWQEVRDFEKEIESVSKYRLKGEYNE